MDRLPTELLYLLLIAGYLLYNLVTSTIARRRERAAGTGTQSDPATEREPVATSRSPLAVPPAVEGFGRTPRSSEGQVSEIATLDRIRETRPPLVRTHRSNPSRPSGVRRSLAGRQSLRQAIVAMTVLGPCRALEDERSTTPPRRRASGPQGV